MSEHVEGCTCPDNDNWMCCNGTVYGPCDSEFCYGVCEYDGRCTCPLHADYPNHGPGED